MDYLENNIHVSETFEDWFEDSRDETKGPGSFQPRKNFSHTIKSWFTEYQITTKAAIFKNILAIPF